ncbi:TetR/AcrR family transcriptional regulator [Paramicrobacterium chengjingii]|uniref:TetR/AcrR family transcriptional regulator n=1 Tax=Paramicrobacterium chengjingii TaxID=2769067 RepID=UPI0014228A5F|nr:TetR family transcriptional regulator [Microbacterium chengjingii]
MPRQSDRRELVAETAIRLIDEKGLAGVSHRAIDKAAGLPIGTTSNYCRTRSALYEAILHKMLKDQVAEVEKFTARVLPGSREDLIELLVGIIEAGGDRQSTGGNAIRERYLARIKLSLVAADDPRLAALMRDIRTASLALLAAQTREVYPHASDENVDVLGSVITGLTVDRTTVGVPTMDLRAVLGSIITGLFGNENSEPRQRRP